MGGPVDRRPSAQEGAVLRLLVEGWTNDEIGKRLGISEQTVKAHVSRLLRKLRSANRAQLAARAVAAGLVPPPSPANDKRLDY